MCVCVRICVSCSAGGNNSCCCCIFVVLLQLQLQRVIVIYACCCVCLFVCFGVNDRVLTHAHIHAVSTVSTSPLGDHSVEVCASVSFVVPFFAPISFGICRSVLLHLCDM